MSPPPVPLAALTVAGLAGVTLVQAFDPAGGPCALFTVPGPVWAADGPQPTLIVHIDRARAADDFETVRGVIAAAAAGRVGRGRFG